MIAWRIARRSTRHLESFSTGAWFPYRRRQHHTVAAVLQRGEDGQELEVTGWVRSLRKQKRVAFAAVGDGSTIDALQAVLKPEQAAELSTGAAVKLQGTWSPSAGNKQSRELQVTKVELLGENDAESSPLQLKYQTPEYLRTIPHLRPRVPFNALLLRLRSQAIAGLTNFFLHEDFVQVHTPIVTSSDCEGAGEVFTISSRASTDSEQTSNARSEAERGHFFRTPKFLTVSAQLHLESLAQAVSKVWTLSPTFRAERSDTPRHLSEFYMLEAEISFTESLDDVMNLVESMLQAVLHTLTVSGTYDELLRARQGASKEETEDGDRVVGVEVLQQRWDGMANGPWPRITYAEAIEKLQTANSSGKVDFAFAPSYEAGLQAEHERYIASTVGRGSPVFVTDYPRAQKPFYMSPSTPTTGSTGKADTVACFDLLVPDLCELAGGSLREHRSKELLESMQAKGVAGNNLEWYHDLRKYGSAPHGGFGLGFDRLLCYLAGVSNTRDVVTFPRWYGRCDC